jgi:MFS family permease
MRIEMQADNITRPVEAKRSVRGHLARAASGFHSLRVRNYRLFIIGQIVSLTGTWMQTTAQDWLVLKLSSSPFALGFVTTLQFLPVTLFALYGGILADRLPKRRTLMVTQSLLLIQAVIFSILTATGVIQLWHIYILAMAQGLVSAIDTPVRQAFVVEMVGREELVNAVALNSMTFNSARILGPSIAGLVIAKIGIAPALYVNAASFIAVIFALYKIDEKKLFVVPASRQQAASAWKRLKEGLAYTWHTPEVLVIMIMLAAIGTFGYNFTVLIPLIAGYVLHTDPQGYGALSSALGIGSVIAALSTAYAKDLRMRRLLLGGAAFSALLALLAVTPVFAASALLLAGLGVSGIIFSTASNSLLQLIVPDELRGRVMSLNVLLIMGSTPVGAFLIGLMSEHFGVPVAILTCAGLCMTGVVVAALYNRQHSPARQQAEASA